VAGAARASTGAAGERRRFGYRRLRVLLRREGFAVNLKRIYRLNTQEGLTVRRRKRRIPRGVPRVAPPTRINERWSLDFVLDVLDDGRRFRILTVVDDFTRACLAIDVDTSIGGRRVAEVLQRLIDTRSKPAILVTNNGPEFIPSAGRVGLRPRYRVACHRARQAKPERVR
jgi:putative transposase